MISNLLRSNNTKIDETTIKILLANYNKKTKLGSSTNSTVITDMQ